MTWVAYHSDLSEVATFRPSEEAELACRRYAMANHMEVTFLPDGVGLREAINTPPDPEAPLVDSDLAALVRETLDLQGCVKIWYSQTVSDMVHIERVTPGDEWLRGAGDDLSRALINYRVKKAQQDG